MAQISKLKHKGKVIYPLTHEDAVVDNNGKPISEKLKEISVGGGEGVLLYNTEQTLTDEQKSLVAKNIGQTRERLILEWSNENAEVLQPIAYDAETGYFTVESMPSWLAEDDTAICVCINYTDDCKNKNANFAHVIQGSFSNSNVTYCTRISSTQFLLHQAQTVMTKITTPTTVNCELFYLTKNSLTTNPQGSPHESMAIPLLPDVSYAPPYGQSGVRKYRIIVDGAACRPCQYASVWFNGTLKYTQGGQYFWVAGGALGHITNSHFNTRLNIVCKIEYLETESYGQILSIDANGLTINPSYKTEGWVNPTLSGQLVTLWGSSEYRIPVLWVKALQHNATVKVYEIIE